MNKQIYARSLTLFIISFIGGWLMQVSNLSDESHLATLSDQEKIKYLLEDTYTGLLPNIGLMLFILIVLIVVYEYLSFILVKLMNKLFQKKDLERS